MLIAEKTFTGNDTIETIVQPELEQIKDQLRVAKILENEISKLKQKQKELPIIIDRSPNEIILYKRLSDKIEVLEDKLLSIESYKISKLIQDIIHNGDFDSLREIVKLKDSGIIRHVLGVDTSDQSRKKLSEVCVFDTLLEVDGLELIQERFEGNKGIGKKENLNDFLEKLIQHSLKKEQTPAKAQILIEILAKLNQLPLSFQRGLLAQSKEFLNNITIEKIDLIINSIRHKGEAQKYNRLFIYERFGEVGRILI